MTKDKKMQRTNRGKDIVTVKTKVVSWYDKKKRKIIWGIDIRVNDREWAHVKDDKGALFFESKKEAKEKSLQIHNDIINLKLP